MNDFNGIRIDIKHSNVEIYEQVLLMSLVNQANQKKYDAIKPVADKLNLYCDTHCIRCIEDCDFLSFPLDKIQYVEYSKEDDVLMFVLKKSSDLHLLNIDAKVHTIYVYKGQHNFIVNYFLKVRYTTWLLYIRYKLRIQLYLYTYKQLYDNN